MKFKRYRIADLLDEISMGPFGSNIKKECFVETGVPVLNGSNLTGIALNDDEFRYVTEEKADSLGKANAHRSDVVVTHRGTLGQISFIPETSKYERYVISQSQFRFRCNEKVLPEYLTYYFHTRKGQYDLLSNASQVGVPALARATTTFQQLEVEIPDIVEQHKIVEIFENFRKKMEINIKINNNLEQQAQAVYYKMFSEVNGEPVELSSIIDVRDGTHDSPKAQATGYYLITSKHLLPFGVDKASANRISKADFDKINERSLVETQDILMSMIGTIGLISYIPYEAVDFAIKNMALFKTSHTPELTYYFLCYLKSEKTLQHIEKCLAGSTQKYISLGELRKMPIYSPTTDEIREFNYLVKPMFEEIVSRTYENALLAEMRDTLLPKLMSGELDVSDIDL